MPTEPARNPGGHLPLAAPGARAFRLPPTQRRQIGSSPTFLPATSPMATDGDCRRPKRGRCPGLLALSRCSPRQLIAQRIGSPPGRRCSESCCSPQLAVFQRLCIASRLRYHSYATSSQYSSATATIRRWRCASERQATRRLASAGRSTTCSSRAAAEVHSHRQTPYPTGPRYLTAPGSERILARSTRQETVRMSDAPAADPIRVFLLDDHEIVRRG